MALGSAWGGWGAPCSDAVAVAVDAVAVAVAVAVDAVAVAVGMRCVVMQLQGHDRILSSRYGWRAMQVACATARSKQRRRQAAAASYGVCCVLCSLVRARCAQVAGRWCVSSVVLAVHFGGAGGCRSLPYDASLHCGAVVLHERARVGCCPASGGGDGGCTCCPPKWCSNSMSTTKRQRYFLASN